MSIGSILSSAASTFVASAFSGSPGRMNRSAVNSSYIARYWYKQGVLQRDVLPFQFLPESIQDSKAAVYGDITVIGRSTPIKTYSHTGAETLAFSLKFFANPEQRDASLSPKLIKERVDFCKSLVYPVYTGFIVKPPPMCIVKIGNYIAFYGVCKSVSTSVTNSPEGGTPWDIDPVTGILPHGVQINLTFEDVKPVPMSMEQVSLELSDAAANNKMTGPAGAKGPGGLPEGLLKMLLGSMSVDDIINILVSSGVQGNLSGGLNTILSSIGFNALNGGSNALSNTLLTGLQSIPGINSIPGVGGVTSYLSGNLSNLISTNAGSALSGLFGRR